MKPRMTVSKDGSLQTSDSGCWSGPWPQYTATLLGEAMSNAADAVEARRVNAAATRMKLDGDMIIKLEDDCYSIE
jgi:hypothetical protein